MGGGGVVHVGSGLPPGIGLSVQVKQGRYCIGDAGCGSGVCGRTVACPPILAHRNITPSSSTSCPPWRGGTHANKYSLSSVSLMHGCWFFSKKVNFNPDLRSKYVSRSDVALLETTFLWHSFLFLFRFLVA